MVIITEKNAPPPPAFQRPQIRNVGYSRVFELKLKRNQISYYLSGIKGDQTYLKQRKIKFQDRGIWIFVLPSMTLD